jgi:hypothetical protein
MIDTLAGIGSGLLAAVCQSVTYLLTRHYAQTRAARGIENAGRQLIVLGHVVMGVLALAIAPFIWPAGVPWRALLLPLAGNVAGYSIGLLAQVAALRHAEASRVGPLMTSKLIVSSILVMFFGMQTGAASATLTPLRWIALPLCIIAGLSISFTGGRMKSQAITAIAVAAVGFSVSDYCITMMLRETLGIPGIGNFQASLVAGLLSYIAAGTVSAALLPLVGSTRPADWAEAVPFGLVWLGSMVGLYFAFTVVGILLGSILQCTRGFITILLAAAVMRLGHHHIEPSVPRRVFALRFAAGVLMFVGIALYVARDRHTLEQMIAQVRGEQRTAPGTR